MKTDERASFLERGESSMVSHRQRTWANQKKGNQIRGNLREKNQLTLSSTARAQIAQEGVVHKGACVTTDGCRSQRSMDLRPLLRDKCTSPPPPKEHVPM